MNIALFDFDGTITNTDTFTKFILFAANKRKINVGKIILLPTIVKYKLGRLHGSEIRKKVYNFAFKGTNERQLRIKGEAFSELMIPNYIRFNAFEKIKWHKQRGDIVVIVSASLDLYLSPWCTKYGLDLICTKVDVVDGILTGNYLNDDCSGITKKQLVEQKYNLSNFDTIYAYGDTLEDEELLSLADERFYQYF